MDDQRIFQIALTKIPHVGAATAKVLIAYCGGLEAVFRERKSSLLKIPNVGIKTVEAILKSNPHQLAEKDVQYLDKNDIKTFFFLDKSFPERLKYYEDSPILLYYKGHPNWNHLRSLAIVGTRRPDTYGKTKCRELIEQLHPYNVQIISGLAYGIDAIAHKSANDFGIENLAIMGTGIDILYPAAHKVLAKKICQNGALITEYPIRSKADRENFPRRNRIIAAMSDAVVIIQSAKKGGSLITAEYANNYHKDVFALPGRATDVASQGCNHLIKRHKAHLIEDAEDITETMRWELKSPDVQARQIALFNDLSTTENEIYQIIKTQEQIHIDKIQISLSLTPSDLARYLLQLEFKGLVDALPGKRYLAR